MYRYFWSIIEGNEYRGFAKFFMDSIIEKYLGHVVDSITRAV